MNEWEWQLLEDKKPIDALCIAGVNVKQGSRVRLRPKPRGDIMDIALAGKTAIIEGIEQDYEGKVHVCVVVDDDPGRDIGLMRQPGHRFFFDAEEVEPLDEELDDAEARIRSREFLSPESATFFWATMPLEWKSRGACQPGEFPEAWRDDFGIRAMTWRTRCSMDTKPPF